MKKKNRNFDPDDLKRGYLDKCTTYNSFLADVHIFCSSRASCTLSAPL